MLRLVDWCWLLRKFQRYLFFFLKKKKQLFFIYINCTPEDRHYNW